MGTPKPGADEHQAPPGGVRASVSLLRRNRDFRRLFLASVISLGGDWFLFVAIRRADPGDHRQAIDVGLAIMAQELPSSSRRRRRACWPTAWTGAG